MTPETISKIQMWRHKVMQQTITEEDMVEAIKVLRQDRQSAAVASETAKRSRAKAAVPDADDLVNELGGM